MESQELIRLSLNALRANKLRSGLTTLGIIIGVFAVILLVSIGSGLQSYITDQISGLGSNLIFVVPGSQTGAGGGGPTVNKLTLINANDVQTRLSGLADVAPMISNIANIKNKGLEDKKVNITGTTANYPQIIKTDMSSGIFFSASQERSSAKVVDVGQTVADKLFPGEDPIGQKISISGGRYTVIGVLAKKGSAFGEDQDNAVFMPIGAAQHLFGVTNVSAIYISSHNFSTIDFVQQQAKDVLMKHLSENDFTVETQQQALSTISNITNILTLALGGIAAISLLVGGIGVMNIMLVSVTERTKEIGLRKALGARREDILKQFLLEAVILSLVGGAVGIILGLSASYILSIVFVSVVTPWSVLLAFLFSVGIGVIFGIAPALRASKLSPMEALRYE